MTFTKDTEKSSQKEDVQSDFARITPAFCDKVMKEWNTNVWDLFGLHLAVKLSFYECCLITVV